MKFKQLGLLFLINSIIAGCHNNNSYVSTTSENPEKDITLIIENDIKQLKGKQLDFVSILDDTSNVRIIYLFNYYDCGTCIYNGFTPKQKGAIIREIILME